MMTEQTRASGTIETTKALQAVTSAFLGGQQQKVLLAL